jgi:uncharacterized protein (DUF169 family)
VIATAEDVSACYAAPRILGFGELPKEPWKRYLGWHFANEEAGKKSFEKFPAFSLGEYKSILISPLERCPVEPDVVIFFGSAAQLMPIILGYLSDKGGELKFRVNGMFACGDAIVTPMKDKRPNIVVPGNSWRILALPSDTELICGLPGELIEENLAGIKFLRSKGGARYPLLWQHLDWGPLGTITEVLRPEGLPTWLK